MEEWLVRAEISGKTLHILKLVADATDALPEYPDIAMERLRSIKFELDKFVVKS